MFVRGLISALSGAVLWGFSGACIQLLTVDYGVSSAFISCVRAVIAAVLFAGFIMTTRRESLLSLLGSKAARRMLVVFGVGLYLSQITYAVSVASTNAGTATVFQSMCTLIVMLVACVQTRRAPQWRDMVGLVCALIAAWLIATQGDFGALAVPVAGLAWGVASALSEALYIVTPQRLFERWDRLTVIGCGMALAGVLSAVVWAATCAATGDWTVPALDGYGLFILVVGVGALGTFAAFGLFLYGVSLVGSVKGSLLGVAEPAGAMVIAAVWLGTAFTAADWAGLVLMAVMIVLVSTSGKDARADLAA